MEANVDHVSEKGEAAMKHYQDKYMHEQQNVVLITQLSILHLIRAKKQAGELKSLKD